MCVTGPILIYLPNDLGSSPPSTYMEVVIAYKDRLNIMEKLEMNGLVLQLKLLKIAKCYRKICFPPPHLLTLIFQKRTGENASGNNYYSM